MSKVIASAVGLLLLLGTSAAVAEQGHEDHGAATAKEKEHAGMDHEGMGMPGMEHGKDMHEMHAHMEALHHHSKMMEGMTDQEQLATEMKKHLRMMDEMMEKMMQRHMQPTTNTQSR